MKKESNGRNSGVNDALRPIKNGPKDLGNRGGACKRRSLPNRGGVPTRVNMIGDNGSIELVL